MIRWLNKVFSMSSDRAFYAFLLCSLVLSIVISLSLVGTRADSSVKELQLQARQTEAKLAVSNLGQFISTRLILLKDLAKIPMLSNAVMGSDISRASLSDFLKDYKVLGAHVPLHLYNVLSEPVFTNSPLYSGKFSREPWLDQMLLGELGQAVVLKYEEQDFQFVLAVPIEYNGFTEGVLISEFKTDLASLLAIDMGQSELAVELLGQWVKYSNAETGLEYLQLFESQLPDTDVEIKFFIDQQIIQNSVNTFILAIAKAVVISLLLSFLLLFFFGRQLLLNPFKQLQLSQKETQKSEERFKLAIKGSNDGIWDWDIEKGSMFFSPRFRELLGYDGNDTNGFPDIFESLERAVHPKDKTNTFGALNTHLESGEAFDIEFRMRNFNGDFRFYRSKGLALRNEHNKAVRMSGSLTDITDQKMYQEALKKAKEHNDLLAYAIESCDVGIVITDAYKKDMPLSFINSAFKRITGYDESVIGKNCRFLQGEQTSPNAVEAIREAIKLQQPHREKILNYRRDGEPFWNNMHIGPVLDENKKLIAYVGILQDVTEQIRQQKALADAKVQAEQASEAKSAFLASMSHEIRTPMNGVLGMLNLMMNSPLDDEQKHRARLAMNSANSLLNLINDILDFSKVDAGKLELELLDFDLRELFGDFSESAALQAQSKGIELILDIVKVDSSVVKGDPSRLRQVLSNLVGNAIKFTDEGEIIIRAELCKVQDKLRLDCSIIDSGIGIPLSKQHKLFETFSQVDSSTTRKYGGTGLGLSIVKKLCELMGGSIGVKSEEGCGSEFYFSIMLDIGEQNNRPMPKFDISKLELLIVDDNQTNRTVLREQLEIWGASVTEAASAIEALSQCETRLKDPNKTLFDIALLDMQMPVMDGAKLGAEMQADPRLNSIKLIMMTSMGHQGDAAYFAKRGFSGYFPKPATTTDLHNALSVVGEDGEALANAKPIVTSHYLKSFKESDDQEPVVWDPKPRLLLAEDNHVNQIVTTSMLKKLGIEFVDVVTNGQEAINTLRHCQHSKPYDLVLMDCQMPEMDGYEATGHIRQGQAGQSNQHIKIIALTANAMSGDEKKCRDAGMDDYLTKPIQPGTLLQCLKAHLSTQNARSDVTE
ncbi:response regulator [Pseudoalteromonas luteoviolacea]|uniref:Sensory/regulatory protein RpfC n=1 Tax=Pseudoalteromonas luteoviolacea S4054 TaxID=1129367 RepID=A0A0F6A836_9GAMM|nr:response regulator [Pseudoalteromonas luteoviolacea]AOT07830.1 hybrid sensor histidine kinase/response regulator [Pseudoalteromonas luteoviolacea]AOT12746.1 hybrid sensor histidine kinase/response regulator [Pseudoalteromonas luteoviolacea]AOT17659.1 hybrid sensor histidine kinase/response regulator [Pseudoalteromonas luteoviolacea]KKE82320.1 hypothetical protein N479_18955 [Pseudoalteromonas luteoviolacea S4054]KZN78972.1 hypothetical protein N481_00585 [Pseudoalteromonas luteoviolacea S40